jgi:hypothetical protein
VVLSYPFGPCGRPWCGSFTRKSANPPPRESRRACNVVCRPRRVHAGVHASSVVYPRASLVCFPAPTALLKHMMDPENLPPGEERIIRHPYRVREMRRCIAHPEVSLILRARGAHRHSLPVPILTVHVCLSLCITGAPLCVRKRRQEAERQHVELLKRRRGREKRPARRRRSLCVFAGCAAARPGRVRDVRGGIGGNAADPDRQKRYGGAEWEDAATGGEVAGEELNRYCMASWSRVRR